MMNREKEIFDAALDLRTPEERAAYINGACGDDTGLKTAVEDLLNAHFEAGDFLPTLPGDVSPVTEGEGSVIGRYKLLQKIGEGGFGIVYMAEQREPVRRRVALKIIKLGMDTKQVIARFEAERQALALMDHPNIARVLDGGTTADGRPYFVMDLVKGLPIVEYCDSEKFSARQRLLLFADVCNAVQHAHQKGVIHRDLKPSNILVASHDGRPVPMIIDFGIAKALQQPLTEQTLFTGFNQMIGTPAYMSPEQAELNALDVDTRADIYTLGILLYELLTGSPPVDPRRLREAGFGEMQRIIREEEPEKPSTRIRTLDEARRTVIAQQRQADPLRLSKTLSGELDWIVLKALEKDRRRRYESAGALGDDIQRHLDGDAVEACPPTKFYLLQKFARKHRLPFGVVGLMMLALLLGLILSKQQAARASRAEKEAVDQLWNSYLVQARSIRSTDKPGRRFESIDAIRKATAIRPSLDLRNEAVAALALADLRPLDLINSPDGAEPPDGHSIDVERGCYIWIYPNDSIGIRNIKSGTELLRLPIHRRGVRGTLFSDSGKYLAVYGRGSSADLTVWDLDDVAVPVLEVEYGSRSFVQFSPDDRYVAIKGERNHVIQIYNLDKSALEREIECGFQLRKIVFRLDGQKIAALSRSNQLSIFDVESGGEEMTLSQTTGFMSACWDPQQKRLATGDRTFGIQIWSLETGEILREFHGHEAEVTRLFFHPNGRFLFSSGWDRLTRVWDLDRGYSILEFSGSLERLSARGDRVGFQLNRAGAGIWEFSGGTPSLKHFRLDGAPNDKVSSLSFSADGQWLVTSRTNLGLWNLNTGQLEAEAAFEAPRDTAFDATGTDVFVGGRSGLARFSLRSIIDENGTSKMTFLRQATVADGQINRLGLSAKGEKIALVKGRSIHLIDAENGHVRKQLAGQPGLENGDAVFSPDGKWLVGTCWSGQGIRIWNLADLDADPVDLLTEQHIIAAKFSPDGQWLLTGTQSSYRFWKTGAWEEDENKRLRRATVRGRGAMAFHPREPILAVSLDGERVQLLDLMTGKTLVELRPPNPTSLKRLSFSRDGSQIAALTSIHDVFVWNLPQLRAELAELELDWQSP